MLQFSTASFNEQPECTPAARCEIIPLCFVRCVLNQEHGSATSPPCISKVKILRPATESRVNETSPVSCQRSRRQLSPEAQQNVEKASGFFSRSFAIGPSRNADTRERKNHSIARHSHGKVGEPLDALAKVMRLPAVLFDTLSNSQLTSPAGSRTPIDSKGATNALLRSLGRKTSQFARGDPRTVIAINDAKTWIERPPKVQRVKATELVAIAESSKGAHPSMRGRR